MKVLIYTDKISGDVSQVDLRIPKDNDVVQKKIDEYNGNAENDRRVSMHEVDGILEEAIKFLLGEKQYKRTYEIEEVCETLESIQGDIRDYQEELSEWHERYEVLQDSLNYAIESVKKTITAKCCGEEIKPKQT